MTAPNVIWAWPWEVNPSMGQWETKPSIVGEGIRYIRADAPELLALVEAGSDVIRASNTLMLMLAGEMSMTKPSLEAAIRLALDARNSWDNALAALRAITAKPTTDALTPWGILPDGSGLDPRTVPIHLGGKASDNA